MNRAPSKLDGTLSYRSRNQNHRRQWLDAYLKDQYGKEEDRTTLERPPEGMAIPFAVNISFFRAVIISPGYFSETWTDEEKKRYTPTPHDAIFRQFLANPDVARDFMMLHLLCGYEDLINRQCNKLPSCSNCEKKVLKNNTWKLLVRAVDAE